MKKRNYLDRKIIGYITSCKYDDSGNASGVPATLYRALKEKYYVYPIIVESKMKRWWIRLIKVFSFGKIKNTHVTFWGERKFLEYKIKRAIEEGISVFVAPMCAPLVAELTGIKKKYNIKIITRSDATYHLLNDFYWKNESKFDIKKGNKTEQRALDNADVVILSNEWAKKDAISYYGIAEEKIKLISFGTSLLDEFTEKDIGIVKKKYKFLLVGKDYKRKGVDIAIKCIQYLNSMNREYEFELTVVGARNEDKIDDCNIYWAGFLNCTEDERTLIELYKSADAFILPSVAECMALSFIEATMYGLPIFAYDVGGNSTAIEQGNTGILMKEGASAKDFAEAIIQSIENGNFRKFGKNARAKYEREFAPDVWKKKLVSVVEDAWI